MDKRASYDQVGDYLYSQDLCVGVYDGTNYNSASCIRSELKPPNNQYPADKMIIRDNTVDPNYGYLASALMNLTSETQAQCVMTSRNTTACWIWDQDMQSCQRRCFYEADRFNSTDQCDRTKPVDSSYVTYVRLSTFETLSGAQGAPGWSLKSVAVATMVLLSLLF